MADDMNPSGSDDDDEIVSDDDGELPAPLPLAMLGSASSENVSKPKPTPKLPTPLKLAKKPPLPSPQSSKSVAVDDITNGHEEAEEAEEVPAPTEKSAAAAATTSTASPTNDDDDDDSDSDDEDDKITTPASMPPHRAIAEPVAEDECASDPFDAAKAAEQARKAATGPGTSIASDRGGGGGGASIPTPIERSPGVVDEALLSLLLMLKGEKNDSLAQVPMELCVHGLVKDDEDNTWPPYEISLPESRKSQTSRQSWLNQKMQEDPNRLLNTILFFNIDPDVTLDSKSAISASEHKLQAILPGVLVNPDGNADAAKRISEYNDSIGSNEWTFAIPVPAQFVKLLYKQHKHGLPTLYNPVSSDKVRFSLFSKIEEQCVKDSRWKLVVDKSREGQATSIAGGSGRGKRAAVGDEVVSKKRSKAAAAAAAAESHVEEATETPPPPAPTRAPPPAQPPPAVQTVLNFAPTPVVVTPGPGSDVNVPLEPQIAKTQLALCTADASTPSMVHTPLNWTSLTPDWFSIIVPKIPEGFVVEMSAPTTFCCGMLSLKRSANPTTNPLDF